MKTTGTNHWAEQFRPITLFLLRFVAGWLFWQHGVWKLFGWFGGKPVPEFSLFWYAGVLESIVTPFFIVGLFTRPIALILCGEMMTAYLTQHLPHGFWPIQNQGLIALQFCSIFLLLATAGPGRFSLDELRGGNSARRRSWLTCKLMEFYPAALTAVRIMTAFLFWQFGARKFFGWLGGHAMKTGSRLWFAGAMETFGAPFIATGALTRLLSFIFSGEMAVAYWTSHYPRGHFWPIQNGGEPAVLFCFIYLFLITAGSGRFSVDGLFTRRKVEREEAVPVLTA